MRHMTALCLSLPRRCGTAGTVSAGGRLPAARAAAAFPFTVLLPEGVSASGGALRRECCCGRL